MPRKTNEIFSLLFFSSFILLAKGMDGVQNERGRLVGRVRRPLQQRGEAQCGQDLYVEEDSRSCNTFFKCENGTYTLEECENGLLFDRGLALSDAAHNYCVYNWKADCGDRPADNTPISSPGCEYRFGIFPIAEGCLFSYNKCEFGLPTEMACEAENENIPTRLMLAFDHASHTCDWPDKLTSLGCDPETLFGFRCPNNEELIGTTNEVFLPFPRFAVEGNPSVYLICVEGLPRLQSCGSLDLFDPERLECRRRRSFFG